MSKTSKKAGGGGSEVVASMSNRRITSRKLSLRLFSLLSLTFYLLLSQIELRLSAVQLGCSDRLEYVKKQGEKQGVEVRGD